MWITHFCSHVWNLVFATSSPESMKMTCQFRRFLARTFRPVSTSSEARVVQILTKTHEGGGGCRISWIGSFPRTKWEVCSGTKIDLIWILSVKFEFSATFIGTKYLNFGADILIFGAKILQWCLFKRLIWEGGEGSGTGGSASVRENIFWTPVTSDCQSGITCTSWLRVTNQHQTMWWCRTQKNNGKRTWPVVNWRVQVWRTAHTRRRWGWLTSFRSVYFE